MKKSKLRLSSKPTPARSRQITENQGLQINGVHKQQNKRQSYTKHHQSIKQQNHHVSTSMQSSINSSQHISVIQVHRNPHKSRGDRRRRKLVPVDSTLPASPVDRKRRVVQFPATKILLKQSCDSKPLSHDSPKQGEQTQKSDYPEISTQQECVEVLNKAINHFFTVEKSGKPLDALKNISPVRHRNKGRVVVRTQPGPELEKDLRLSSIVYEGSEDDGQQTPCVIMQNQLIQRKIEQNNFNSVFAKKAKTGSSVKVINLNREMQLRQKIRSINSPTQHLRSLNNVQSPSKPNKQKLKNPFGNRKMIKSVIMYGGDKPRCSLSKNHKMSKQTDSANKRQEVFQRIPKALDNSVYLKFNRKTTTMTECKKGQAC